MLSFFLLSSRAGMGLPRVFPSGLGKERLPIGVQVASGPYQDYKTIEVSRLISREIGGFEAPDL